MRGGGRKGEEGRERRRGVAQEKRGERMEPTNEMLPTAEGAFQVRKTLPTVEGAQIRYLGR